MFSFYQIKTYTAKIWGPDDGMPVLALHGWQDNAGTYDTLAPLLPNSIRLICLDFCGIIIMGYHN